MGKVFYLKRASAEIVRAVEVDAPFALYPELVASTDTIIHGIRLRGDPRVPVGEIWAIDPNTGEKVAELIL